MISDSVKKEALEALLQELEMREVDGMDKEPGAVAGETCPYCDGPASEDNPACSMHGLHSKAKPPAAAPEESVLKIKIGGKSPKKDEAY